MQSRSPKLNFLDTSETEEGDSFDNLVHVQPNEYRPNKTGVRLHLSLARTRIVRGGLGCVADSTRVWTRDGLKAIGDISQPTDYLSWDGASCDWAKGTAPFVKGKENLYRVVFSDGSELHCAGAHLILGQDSKYHRISEISPGFQPFVPPDANAYAGSLSSTLNYQGDYSDGRGLCDELLRFAARVGQAFAPLPAYGIGHNFGASFFHGNHQEQDTARTQTSKYSSPVYKAGGFLHGLFQEAVYPAFFSSTAHLSTHNLASGQSQFQKNRERVALKQQQLLLRKQSFCVSSRVIKPLTVIRVEQKNKAEWYWDLQVPGTHCYLLENNTVQHNSGKTRASSEHVNNLALQYPGSLHFIGRKDITTLKDTTQREFLEFVVRPETVQSFNINENKLYYKNGSIVLFKELKDKQKVKSLQLTSYLLDEADENEDESIWSFLDDRLRQKVWVDGVLVTPPYVGMLVFNPTHDEHWLCELSKRTDISIEDFKFSTYENENNLPDDYIPNLLKKLPPWDIDRLVHGNWGRQIHGKPVFHGFTYQNNVRPLKLREDLPLIRGWDFGFGHPAVRFAQIDPVHGRYLAIREFFASKTKLADVAVAVKQITSGLGGPSFPVVDWGDPHGNDQKDNADSSIEYLRLHHDIFVMSKPKKIKTGIEEIQHRILTQAPFDKEKPELMVSQFLVDPSCKVSIASYSGGYHRDETGEPVKDGYYDHLIDCDRYVIANNMGSGIKNRFKNVKRYHPRNRMIGV